MIRLKYSSRASKYPWMLGDGLTFTKKMAAGEYRARELYSKVNPMLEEADRGIIYAKPSPGNITIEDVSFSSTFPFNSLPANRTKI